MQLKYLFTILILIATYTIHAQSLKTTYDLKLKSGKIILKEKKDIDIPLSFESNSIQYLFIQFYKLPTFEEHQLLKQLNIEVLEYIPDFAYYISIRSNVIPLFIKNFKIRHIDLISPSFKIDNSILKDSIPAWALKELGTVDLVVRYFKNTDPTSIQNALLKEGAKIIDTKIEYHQIIIRIPKNKISILSEINNLAFVSIIPPPLEIFDIHASANHRDNILTSRIAGERNLTGDGITVGIGDLYCTYHSDLQNRVTNLQSSYGEAPNDHLPHGNLVSGIVGGNGNINEDYVGIARKTYFYRDDFDSILKSEYYKKGVLLTNNSYGGPGDASTYNSLSKNLDNQLSNPNFNSLLHIFAAGNSGPNYGTLPGSYQSAKNPITVGAIDLDNIIESYSSRGPTLDGRIKPELVSTDLEDTSTYSKNNEYYPTSGTSFSAPVITGISALLYQRYKQLHNGLNPDGGLIKAILCNTADDLGNSGPDYSYGFGKVNARKAIENLEAGKYFTGTVNTGQSKVHIITVPSNTVQLKVMLYWKDKGAADNSSIALVNNLDLRVTTGGNTTLPWVLNPSSPNSLAVRGDDNLNNIEQVTINSPPSGTYNITIDGTGISMASQDYVLVYEIVSKYVVLTYPYGGESFTPNETLKIQWDAAGSNNLTMQYSINGGTWTTIQSNVSPSLKQLEWNIPNLTSPSKLDLRITDGSIISQTKSFCSIINRPTNLIASSPASGSILLKWKKITGTNSYDIYLLRPYDKEIQLIASTSDTSFLIQGLQNTVTYYLSVKAKTSTDIQSKRAVAITYKISSTPNCTATGTILRELWTNVSGSSVDKIPVLVPPTNTSQINILEGPSNSGDSYGARYRGYICPHLTRSFTFYIASDNDSELWISPDEYPQHKELIGYVKGSTNPRSWNTISTQSGGIYMEAGKQYYIEVLHKEDSGNDHVSVMWQWAPDASEGPIPGTRLSPFIMPLNNNLPTVNVSSPTNGQTFGSPATISINANATDSDGSIQRVEFYQGNSKIGVDSISPFTILWSNVPPGFYSITAKAFDNAQSFSISNSITINVTGVSCASTGTITRDFWANITGGAISSIPINNTPTSTAQLTIFDGQINAGDNFGARYRGYICAPATGNYTFWISSDDNSELWLSTNDNPANKVKIAYVTGWTYTSEWEKYSTQKSSQISLVADQKYYIEALHKEITGDDHLSVGWQIPGGIFERPIPGNRLIPFNNGNNPPTVSITSPTNNSSFTSPATITINANASDTGGSITKVEFFQGSTKLGEDLTSPYSFSWSNVSVGSYSLTAKATDNGGAQTTSTVISITVTSGGACSATGNIVREVWNNISGSDASLIPVNTSPTITSAITTYRGPNNAGDNYGARIRGYICAPATGNYTFWISSDDNSELWLSTNDNPANKVKIAYVIGLTNSLEFTKYPSQQSAQIPLVAGKSYYIEALHKESTGTDHVAVGWKLPDGIYERPIPGNRLSPFTQSSNNPPTVFITSPTNNSSFTSPATITINANASDTDGSITKVEFFQGSTKLGEDLASPYSFSWSNVSVGSYSLTAKATDNGGAQTTSAVISVTVTSRGTCTASGNIVREVWNNISGSDVSLIPVNATPTSTSIITTFRGPNNVGDNYGARIRGYICAPATGNYTFWISSDDNSELWLSTNDNPANKVKIAYVIGLTNSLEFTKYPSQQSAQITLVAGKSYYIEALHKESTGTDHVAVGWKLPDGTYERPIPGNRLSPYSSSTSLAKEAITFDIDTLRNNTIITNVFPNPTKKGYVTVTVEGYEKFNHQVNIDIYDLQGILILSKTEFCDITCPKTMINIDEKFKPGTYIINVQINGNLVSKRLLLE